MSEDYFAGMGRSALDELLQGGPGRPVRSVPEEQPPDPVASEGAGAGTEAVTGSDDRPAPAPAVVPAAPAVPEAQPVAAPVPSAARSRVTFNGKASQVRDFPTQVVDMLRRAAGRVLGEAAVERTSAARLLTAYVVAVSGMQLDGLDEDTMTLVAAFASMDPLLSRLDRLLEHQERSDTMMRMLVRETRDTRATVEATELGASYLLANNTAMLEVSRVNEKTIDLRQPVVLSLRKRIQEESMRQRRAELQSQGRPIR